MFVRAIFLPYIAFRYFLTGTLNFGGQHAELASNPPLHVPTKGTSLFLDLSIWVPLIVGAWSWYAVTAWNY